MQYLGAGLRDGRVPPPAPQRVRDASKAFKDALVPAARLPVAFPSIVELLACCISNPIYALFLLAAHAQSHPPSFSPGAKLKWKIGKGGWGLRSVGIAYMFCPTRKSSLVDLGTHCGCEKPQCLAPLCQGACKHANTRHARHALVRGRLATQSPDFV
eukprot:353301-Pelagomonas_calceolata.AAC.2